MKEADANFDSDSREEGAAVPRPRSVDVEQDEDIDRDEGTRLNNGDVGVAGEVAMEDALGDAIREGIGQSFDGIYDDFPNRGASQVDEMDEEIPEFDERFFRSDFDDVDCEEDDGDVGNVQGVAGLVDANGDDEDGMGTPRARTPVSLRTATQVRFRMLRGMDAHSSPDLCCSSTVGWYGR